MGSLAMQNFRCQIQTGAEKKIIVRIPPAVGILISSLSFLSDLSFAIFPLLFFSLSEL